MTSSNKLEKPPLNTLFVNRWSDLPNTIEPQSYHVEETRISVQKKTRQVLEGLMRQPLACASRCRISDRVLMLRRDCGLEIEMKLYKGGDGTGVDTFGVYFLKSAVERVQEPEAA